MKIPLFKATNCPVTSSNFYKNLTKLTPILTAKFFFAVKINR